MRIVTYLFALALFFFSVQCGIAAENSLKVKNEYRVVLEPIYLTKVASEVTSVVDSINKKMGQNFDKDELLMALDSKIFDYNYKKALASLEKAKAHLDAQRQLFNDKSASFTDFKDAESNFATAEAEVALAKKALDSCVIMGPYRGKVQDVYVQEHERVEPGQKLMLLIDDSVLVAKFLLQSSAIDRIAIGQVVEVALKDSTDRPKAKIARIAAANNPVSSLIEVDAEIDNSDGKLRAGMVGTLQLGS